MDPFGLNNILENHFSEFCKYSLQVRDDRRRGSIDPARSSSKSPRGVMGSNRWPTPQSADQSPGNKRASDDTYDLQQESAKKVRVSDNDVNDPNSTSLVE